MHAKIAFDNARYRLDVRTDHTTPDAYTVRLEINISERGCTPVYMHTGYAFTVDASTAFAEYAVIFDALIHEYETERTTADE